MRQILQDVRSGTISVHEVPEPSPAAGYALVAVRHSVISAGTERALAGLGAKSLLQKARARPDLVRKTLDTARAEGVGATVAKVRGRLDEYTAFGYSCAGEVLDTGGDPKLAVGGLVACVGQGHASHAEVVSVPTRLVVPLPDGVSTEAAAFAAPAAIALHAIRLGRIEPGSVVAVIGLGLIGQLAGRLLRASGAVPVGLDPRADRREAFGSADLASAGRGRGADAVLVCAATASHEPLELAAELARDRASIVVVGDVGLELDRRVFYEKELALVVARSYGPGRYDRDYEERGLDYPIGHVRWTESRNVEAVVDLLASGSLRVDDLVTHRFAIADGERAFDALEDEASLAVLLAYETPPERRRSVRTSAPPATGDTLRVGLIGAGAFARGTLVPALESLAGVRLAAVCARSGASAKSLGDRHGVAVLSTDWRAVVASEDIDALIVATPHAEHAAIAAAGLRAGKAVFVEKPLAIDRDGLAEVADAAAESGRLLVGHNRRFAPLALQLREAVHGPVAIAIRVAAGPLAAGHWLNDPAEGGRIVGEASHFVDLATFLAGSLPASVFAATVPVGERSESLAATIRFANGSVAMLLYGVGPVDGLAKERVEVLGASGAAVLDDFAKLEVGGRRMRSRRDKGHRQQLEAFVRAARGEAELPVPVDEQLAVASATLALLESARTGEPVSV